MAVMCPIDLDKARLRTEVQTIYSRVATTPDGQFHFHRGPAYASTMLGYDANELAALPLDVTSSFAGVGNPHAIDRVSAGATVLDIGCGAGTDLLIAAQMTGPAGRVIGVDMTASMLATARASAGAMGLATVDLHDSLIEAVPVNSASVDVVIANGVIDLVPDKDVVLDEIDRVLRPGGRLQLADVVIHNEVSEDARGRIDLWTG